MNKLSIINKQLPKLAVFKFASCDGCQLTLLDCEDEILQLAKIVEIAHFPEATKTHIEGPYDITLIEGSITTEHDRALIQQIRASSKKLITIGACANAGGIQALKNFASIDSYKEIVYARPEYISTLATSTPISDHVHVDFELQGCPISKEQLLEVINSFVLEKVPCIKSHSVCVECKIKNNVCVAVAHGKPCLGPVTHAGCGAICPSYNRGCYGCYGPKETPDPSALTSWWEKHLNTRKETIKGLLSNFNCAAEAFKKTWKKYDE